MDDMWRAKDRYGNDLSCIPWREHCIEIYNHTWPSKNLKKFAIYTILSPQEADDSDDSNDSDEDTQSESQESFEMEEYDEEPQPMRPLNVWNSPIIKLIRNSFLFKVLSVAAEKNNLKDCLVFNPRTGLLTHNIKDDVAPVEPKFNKIVADTMSGVESVNYFETHWEKYPSLHTLTSGDEYTSLSKCLLWKFNGNCMTYEVFFIKIRTWKRLQVLLRLSGISGELELIGSTFTGLADMKSDLDLNLKTNVQYGNLSQSWVNLFILLKFQMVLNRYEDIRCIKLKKSQTPSIRCVITSGEDGTGRQYTFNVDIYCNSDYTASTKLVTEMISKNCKYQPLLVLLKNWLYELRKYNLEIVFINSYTITLLGISFFLNRAKAKVTAAGRSGEEFDSDSDDDDDVSPGNTLWDLFIEFFAYYSCFDFGKAVISVRLGRILPKDEYRLINREYDAWIQYMSVEDPGFMKNTAQNICTDLILAQNVAAFKATHQILLNATKDEEWDTVFKIFKKFTF